MSMRNCRCRTYSGELIVSCVSNPSNPLAFVANGMSWRAPKVSNWIQVGHAVENPQGAVLAARMRWAAARSSAHVVGGFSGSRPALRKASLLYQRIGVLLLNGKAT